MMDFQFRSSSTIEHTRNLYNEIRPPGETVYEELILPRGVSRRLINED